MHLGRAKARWWLRRRAQSYMDHMVDSVCDKTSKRLKRRTGQTRSGYELKKPVQQLSDSERKELLLRLRARRQKKCQVVFFGNGTFPHHKGYAPVAKKAVVRRMCTKTTCVVVNEYLTSKMCPCGESELEDVPKELLPDSDNTNNRYRRHKDGIRSNQCCRLCEDGVYLDRDVAACVNLALCAYESLVHARRPMHLNIPS